MYAQVPHNEMTDPIMCWKGKFLLAKKCNAEDVEQSGEGLQRSCEHQTRADLDIKSRHDQVGSLTALRQHNDGNSRQRGGACAPDPDLADLLRALRVLQHTRQPSHKAVLPRRVEAAPPRPLHPRAVETLSDQQ